MASPLDRLPGQEPEPQQIIVDGIPVDLELAAAAVSRVVVAIPMLDSLIDKGFAGIEDLTAIRTVLRGSDDD